MNIRIVVLLVSLAAAQSALAGSSDKKQAELDAACEAAREAKLAPMRAEFIEECVDKKQRPDRASCERFYADFGNQAGDRAPLFYDLPECVKAFEHSRSR